MRKIIWQLVIPLTIIIFASIDKWTYALVVDAPDTILNGFPFISSAEAWYTSMATQIFILEFSCNFLIFFTSVFLIVYLISKIFKITQIHKWIYIPLWVFTTPIIILAPLGVLMFDDIILTHRDFKIQILDQNFFSSWTGHKRPELKNYVLTQTHYNKSKTDIDWTKTELSANNYKRIERSSNPFLQSNYTTKKVERLVFIDSTSTITKHQINEIQKVILDSKSMTSNFDKKEYRFVVINGIIFFNQANQMTGSLSFNYDYKDVYFNPKFRSQSRWKLSKTGQKRIKEILAEK